MQPEGASRIRSQPPTGLVLKPGSSDTALRVSVPLALFTATGMLATDLYLPAVPHLPTALGGTVAEAQLTLASCLTALAVSQLLWGWASDRYGETRVIRLGIVLLGGASALGALAPNLPLLIVARAFQGFGAGASTAAVPSLLAKRFPGPAATRGIALVGTAESIVPAIGPLLGTIVIAYWGWRATFVIIAILTVALVPAISRVIALAGDDGTATRPDTRPEIDGGGFGSLIRDSRFLKAGLAYSALFGALVLFVSAAPQVMAVHFPDFAGAFSFLQIAGVLSFGLSATVVSRFVVRRAESAGENRLVKIGCALQILACVLFAIESFRPNGPVYAQLVLAWSAFCAGMGMNGPVSMGRALGHASSRAGKASGLMMFASFGLASAAIASLAPYLDRGLPAAALALSLLTSLSLVFRIL